MKSHHNKNIHAIGKGVRLRKVEAMGIWFVFREVFTMQPGWHHTYTSTLWMPDHRFVLIHLGQVEDLGRKNEESEQKCLLHEFTAVVTSVQG